MIVQNSEPLLEANQPECQICHPHLTVKHILIDCTCFCAARQRYLGVDTLKKLFENVDSRIIVALLKIQTFVIVYNVVFIYFFSA